MLFTSIESALTFKIRVMDVSAKRNTADDN